MKKKSHKIIKEMVYISMFAVLITICSWISIPTAIPFTLQTFGVMVTLGLLGGRRGTFSIFLFLLLGLIGIPVFSGFSAGVGALFGLTGGYLMGFLLMGIAYWLFTFLFKDKFFSKIIGIIAGLVLCYVFGTFWFMHVYNEAGGITLAAALGYCVTPFLLPEIIKIAIALIIINRLSKYIKL